MPQFRSDHQGSRGTTNRLGLTAKTVGRLLVLALAAQFLSLLSSPPASAVGCGALTHLFNGKWTAYSTANFGGHGIIDRALPSTVCGTAGSSIAWVLLAPTGCYHAQIGNGRISGSTDDTHVFTEYIGQDCGIRRVVYGIAGGAGTYDVYRVASTGHVAMSLNGTTFDQTPYNVQGVWSAAWTVQFGGETWHEAQSQFTADYLPGSAANKVKFASLMAMNSSGGFNYISSFPNSVNHDPTHFNRENYASGYPSADFRIWDSRN